MDLRGKAREIERKLARTMDVAIGELVGHGETAPLEIVHAVLDRAERQVQEIGRGRRVFPFNRIRVQIATARDREARARIEAVLAGPPSLVERVQERLRACGCAVSPVTIDVSFVAQRGAAWPEAGFHVTFDRVAEEPALPPAPTEPAPVPRIKLTIARGRAPQRVYVFTGGRIDLGRRAEVLDQRQRLIRTNHVAFDDEGDENMSVSRRHAHIAYSEADRVYRVYDDRSAQGTSVVRGGRTIKVAPGARGARLQSGDEVVLGRARLKVTIADESAAS